MQNGLGAGSWQGGMVGGPQIPVEVVGNRASPLAGFADRQRQIVATIGELTTRLHKQCDALMGGAPPVPGNAQANPIRDGALGQIADALDATDNVLGWLRSVVERVESL